MALKSVFCHQDKTNARWITAFLPQHCKIILNISIFLCHFQKCFIYLQHALFCHLLDPLFHSFQLPPSLIQRSSCKCPLSGIIIGTLTAIQTLKNSQKRRKKMYQSKRKVINVNNIAKPEILRCRILPTCKPLAFCTKKNHLVLTRYSVQHLQIFADSSYKKQVFPVVALHWQFAIYVWCLHWTASIP